MKKHTLVIICSLFIFSLHTQAQSTCDSIHLPSNGLIKSDDPCLITAINYILEHPITDNSSIHVKYMRLIVSWMDKTTITFNLNDNVLTFCKDDNLLLFDIYMAALAKAAIETKNDFVPEALRLLVAYIKKTENGVKQTSKIRKMIVNVKENKFEKYQ